MNTWKTCRNCGAVNNSHAICCHNCKTRIVCENIKYSTQTISTDLERWSENLRNINLHKTVNNIPTSCKKRDRRMNNTLLVLASILGAIVILAIIVWTIMAISGIISLGAPA